LGVGGGGGGCLRTALLGTFAGWVEKKTPPSLPDTPYPPPPHRQTTVKMTTSYADTGVYQFNHVFDEGYTHQDVFERLTPVINDAFLGISGAIMVSGGPLGAGVGHHP
jgi:hypothetical protein